MYQATLSYTHKTPPSHTSKENHKERAERKERNIFSSVHARTLYGIVGGTQNEAQSAIINKNSHKSSLRSLFYMSNEH